MRTVQVFTSIFLFIVFFIWSFGGSYGALINFYFPYLPIFFFIVLVPFSIPGFSEKFFKILSKLEKYSFVIFPAFIFIFTQYVWHDVFSGIPHVQDEINFKYLATAILDGKLTSPLHPHYEFFRFLYIIPSESGTYSIYDIGYPIVLAPFLYFKVPFLLNPLLSSFSIYFSGRIAEELYDRHTASLSMMLASFSLFLSSMGGTWMSHSLCAFLTLGAALFAIKSLKKDFVRNTVISALLISALMFSRPQNALFVLFSIVLFYAFFAGGRNFIKSMLISGSIIFLFFLLFNYTHYIFSGAVLTGKHSVYWNISEPVDDCMRLGLGNGCRHATLIDLPAEGLTFTHAVYTTYLRLNQLVYGMFFHPLMFIFISIMFLFKTNTDKFKKDLFVLFCFLIIFFTYFFFYFDGNVYGPRYYYEAAFFLMILASRGIMLFFNKFNIKSKNPLLRPVNLFSAFLIAGIIFQFVIAAPAFFKPHRLAFWGADPLLYKALEEKNIKKGLIFINPHSFYSSGMATMNIHDIDSNDLIFARDLGPFQNRRLMNHYPEKSAYLVNFNKEWFEERLPDIIELKKEELPDIMSVELEDKEWPLSGSPDYCNAYPAWKYIDKYAGFELEPELISGKKFFFCRFIDNSEHYSFGQYFEKEGRYIVRIHHAKTPAGAKFRVSTGRFSSVVNFSGVENKLSETEFAMDFKKGLNIIKIQPRNIKEKKSGYFIIDRIEFQMTSD